MREDGSPAYYRPLGRHGARVTHPRCAVCRICLGSQVTRAPSDKRLRGSSRQPGLALQSAPRKSCAGDSRTDGNMAATSTAVRTADRARAQERTRDQSDWHPQRPPCLPFYPPSIPKDWPVGQPKFCTKVAGRLHSGETTTTPRTPRKKREFSSFCLTIEEEH
jgi:hypothetical protein